MQHLPYNAQLRPYNAIATSKLRRYPSNTAEECGTCSKLLDELSYIVIIPRQQRDGIWYAGDWKRCCSQECALTWLERVTLHLGPAPGELKASSKLKESRKPITDTLPTQEKRDGWVYAFCEKSDYPKHAERCGKWLIYFLSKDIDVNWQRIKQAVEQGLLGSQAKVSTSASQRVKRSDQHVICVFTYDYEDSTDVRRIRQVLHDLGITRKLSDKSDEDTLNKRYGSNFRSMYYE